MKRLLNQLLAAVQLALRRTWTTLGSHAAVALGVLVATTAICALILYAEGISVAVLRDRLARAHEDAVYDLLIKGEASLMDRARYEAMDAAIAQQVEEVIGLPVTRGGRHGWSKSLLVVPPRSVARLSEQDLVSLRRHQVGFVFQSFGLLPQFSAYENVDLILRLAHVPRTRRHDRAVECLTMVGLEHRMHHRPYELSSGQQQRLCIARAIANHPTLILADEPTGELDSRTGREILSLFHQIVALEESALVVATHDPVVGDFATTVYQLDDSQLTRSSPGEAPHG